MKNNTRKTLSIYLKHMKKYRLMIIVVIFSLAVSAFIDSAVPVVFKTFFDVLVGGDDKGIIAATLVKILLFIFVLKIIDWLFKTLANFLMVRAQVKIMSDLSNTCFKYLHKHSFSYFSNNFSGSLVKKVNYFVDAFESLMDMVFYEFLRIFIVTPTIIIVLFFRNYLLGLGIFIWLVIWIIVNIIFAKYKYKYDVAVNEMHSKTSGFLSDTISNISNVKLFNGYQRETSKFAKLYQKLNNLKMFAWNLSNIFEAIQVFFIVILQVGIFYIAIILWQKDILTYGDFVLLQSYVIIIIMNGWQLTHLIRRTFRTLSDAEEMTIILNTPHEIVDVKNAKKLEVSQGKIEFRDVDFNYKKTRKVLNSFNLIIKPGERVALIGPSGAGKSTLIKLILRNYDLERGKILIDEQVISRVSQESLWKNIGIVAQDSILFHRTLKENIAYGNPGASMEDIIAAAKLAHCHEFIKNFPQGYNTYVGERGIKLSGGERQRIAIARVILKNAPILVLDEATSSLDSVSERLIQDALDKLMKNKTVIVIAHRLSTIRKMDRIVYIDKGVIKEEGRHDNLKNKQGGFYNKLWSMQVGGFIE